MLIVRNYYLLVVSDYIFTCYSWISQNLEILPPNMANSNKNCVILGLLIKKRNNVDFLVIYAYISVIFNSTSKIFKI